MTSLIKTAADQQIAEAKVEREITNYFNELVRDLRTIGFDKANSFFFTRREHVMETFEDDTIKRIRLLGDTERFNRSNQYQGGTLTILFHKQSTGPVVNVVEQDGSIILKRKWFGYDVGGIQKGLFADGTSKEIAFTQKKDVEDMIGHWIQSRATKVGKTTSGPDKY